jgi:hypothetical protein
MSGATIIAPITVAVESDTIPADAITEARMRRIQNLLSSGALLARRTEAERASELRHPR